MAILQTTEVPVGSAGTPSLTFTGRTNDGIYSPADDQVAVTTGGTQRLLIGNATLTYNTNNVAVKNADGTLTGADGTAATHYVTKQQLDSISAGYDPKQSARVATTGAETYTISGGAVTQIAGTSVDGVTGAVNDRILIKDAPASSGAGSANSTQPANGIYVVTNATTNLTVTRATDADVSAEVTGGMYVFVTEGTANADSGWVLATNDTITLNTTALNFVQFTGAGQITAGNALTKTGNTLDVAVDNVGIEINSDALRLKDLGVVTAKLETASSTTTGVTFPKMRQIATDRLIGRDTAATGAPEEISLNATLEFTGSASIQRAALTGDVTATAGSNATTIANDAVTNAKLANMAAATIKGRAVGAGTGDPTDLTADQTIAIINSGTTDIDDARLTTNVALLNVQQSFSKSQTVTRVALTDAANIATDASLSNVFSVTLAGNRTLDNPTNLSNGQSLIWIVTQDATGTRTLAFGTKFDFKGSSTVSTSANAVDVISGIYNSTSDKIVCTLARQDSAAINADTLDGLDSTLFLRTNGANTATAAITNDDTTRFWMNLSGLLTTGIKWDTTANQIQFQDAGTTRAYIDLDNGELSATSIVETSDERLKENITNIDSTKALKQIKKMQGVYFDRKDTGLREVGLIAQRVQALEPLLVQEGEDGYLAVNYSRVVALLIESIKEQQQQIDTLRRHIDAFRNGDGSVV
jgi:hypothetical protein